MKKTKFEQLLKEKNITVKELAEKIHIGERSIRNWINDKNSPSLPVLDVIQAALACPFPLLIDAFQPLINNRTIYFSIPLQLLLYQIDKYGSSGSVYGSYLPFHFTKCYTIPDTSDIVLYDRDENIVPILFTHIKSVFYSSGLDHEAYILETDYPLIAPAFDEIDLSGSYYSTIILND